MKSPGRNEAVSGGRAAFTLIELLAVMAIILVLAGLILNIAGSAQYNSAKARATAEIHALETALENYKSDNGSFPPDPFTPTTAAGSIDDLLNPQKDYTDPTIAKYINNSEYLYQVLSGFPVSVGNNPSASSSMTKSYFNFTPAQLHAVSSSDVVSPTNAKMYIIDPFGFSYGYSTVYSAYTAQQQAAGTNQPNTSYGYNPTFDLWSTGGYAPGGKATPSNNPTGLSKPAMYSSLWIKNW